MTAQRIKPTKLADVIASQLEQLILEGSLSPGERLPAERELARQFEVSRPSVREAVQRLEAKQLLVRRQGGGTFVRKTLKSALSEPLFELLNTHPEAQGDLLEFRHALEGIAAFYAAQRGTPQEYAQLQACQQSIAEAQAAQDVKAEAQGVVAFYLAVAEASHNAVVLHLMRAIAPLLESNVLHNLKSLYRREGVGPQVLAHRERLLRAILDGDAERARAAAYQLLQYVEQMLESIGAADARQARSLRRHPAPDQ